MLNNSPAIGIDFGATNLRAGLVEGDRLTDIRKRALPADKSVMSVVSVMCEMIKEIGDQAASIQIVLYTYDPDTIIMGGSVTKANPFFRDGFEKELKSFGFSNSLKNVDSTISDNENVAVLGAAALCKNHMKLNTSEQ